MKQLAVVEQVADAVVDDPLSVLVKLAMGSPATEVLGEGARRASLQQRQNALVDPLLQRWAPFLVEAVCDLPEVFEHVDQVEDDRHVYAHLLDRLLHLPELIAVAVHQDDPTPLPFRIAPQT